MGFPGDDTNSQEERKQEPHANDQGRPLAHTITLGPCLRRGAGSLLLSRRRTRAFGAPVSGRARSERREQTNQRVAQGVYGRQVAADLVHFDGRPRAGVLDFLICGGQAFAEELNVLLGLRGSREEAAVLGVHQRLGFDVALPFREPSTL